MATTLSQDAQNDPLTTTSRGEDPYAGLVRVELDLSFEGTAAFHIEPHSHAITWGVQPFGELELRAMRVLRPEDRITISSPKGEVLFDGPLTSTFHLLDPVRVYRDLNGHNAPPTGFAIYWSPKGIEPHQWLFLFEHPNQITVHRHSTALVSPDYTFDRG